MVKLDIEEKDLNFSGIIQLSFQESMSSCDQTSDIFYWFEDGLNEKNYTMIIYTVSNFSDFPLKKFNKVLQWFKYNEIPLKQVRKDARRWLPELIINIRKQMITKKVDNILLKNEKKETTDVKHFDFKPFFFKCSYNKNSNKLLSIINLGAF